MSVKVNIKKNNLGRAATQLPGEVELVIEKFLNDVAATADGTTPVETGKLKGSRGPVEMNGTEGRLEWSADYGLYVHEGTRFMAARPFAADAVEQESPKVDQALGQIENKLA